MLCPWFPWTPSVLTLKLVEATRAFVVIFVKLNLSCSSAGAYILGPRAGRFKDGKVMQITGHSLPLVSLGGFILIMGFMAFNGGSQASISQPGDGEAIGRAVQVRKASSPSGVPQASRVIFFWNLIF